MTNLGKDFLEMVTSLRCKKIDVKQNGKLGLAVA